MDAFQRSVQVRKKKTEATHSYRPYYLVGFGIMVLVVGFILFTWYNGFYVTGQKTTGWMLSEESNDYAESGPTDEEYKITVLYKVDGELHTFSMPAKVGDYVEGKVIDVYYNPFDVASAKTGNYVIWPMILIIIGAGVTGYGFFDWWDTSREERVKRLLNYV